jgi:hypothetical protein
MLAQIVSATHRTDNVKILLSPVLTTISVPLILVIMELDADTFQSIVLILILALLIPVVQLQDVFILQFLAALYALELIAQQSILVLLMNVILLMVFANNALLCATTTTCVLMILAILNQDVNTTQ